MKSLTVAALLALISTAFGTDPKETLCVRLKNGTYLCKATGKIERKPCCDTPSNELKLPSREPAVVIPLLRAFTAANTYPDVVKMLGKPELNIGSAGPDAIFTLSDGSHINVRAFDQKISEITLHPPHRAVSPGRGEFLYSKPKDVTIPLR